MDSTFSIITPSFNQGRFIERTLNSVFSQQLTDITLEYWVIDGGSSDETLTHLEQHASQPGFHYLSEPDHGQSHAVNKGLQCTQGEIIGWLNSDDIYLPHTLQHVNDFFRANPEVDVLYGEAVHIDTNDKFINAYPIHHWDKVLLKWYCFISQPAVFFRRRVIKKYGVLDETLHYCMDYEYWLRLADAGARFAYLPHPLAATRLYPDTKTLRDPLLPCKEAMHMLQKKFGSIPLCWHIKLACLQQRLHSPSWLKKLLRPATLVVLSVKSAYQRDGWTAALKLACCFPLLFIQLIILAYTRRINRANVTTHFIQNN